MKKQSLFLFGILTFSLVVSPLTVISQKKDAPDFSDFEKALLKDFEERGAPGAAVAIISGDRIIYSKLVGSSSVEMGVPVTADTLFLIGVTSRVFVSRR